MGKSPAKWIKTLLFGKKATRSLSSKGRSASNVAKRSPASTESSPVISEPVLVSTHSNGINPELEKGKPSNLGGDGLLVSHTSQGAESLGISGPGVETDPEKLREEQAAIKAQAAFRGFLARRAFHALRGIIRLQALVRGHLVRRQAVSTLRSMLGIIKLQALARGQKVAKRLDSRKNKLYTNTFVCKYEQGEPNSVFSWMDRWTFSRFWKSPFQPKKTLDSKSQTKRGTYAMETESGRTKRSVRRNSLVNVDSGLSNNSSEPEKTKRNIKKVSSSTDSVSEQPQSELEKVKRNLRKVTASMIETSERSEVESEKQSCGVKKMVDMPSDAPHLSIIDESEEKTKKDIASIPEAKPDMETVTKSVAIESPDDNLLDDPVAKLPPLQSIDKDENISVMNGDLSCKEEQTCIENQKLSKRRTSFSAKSEYTENGVQNTPILPSYMQATESAKAKLRGQNSPHFGADSAEKKDSAEKSGITRRHSLPSSTNGKVTSHSPRTQRIQASGKAGIRGDRSLLSSRDGSGFSA